MTWTELAEFIGGMTEEDRAEDVRVLYPDTANPGEEPIEAAYIDWPEDGNCLVVDPEC